MRDKLSYYVNEKFEVALVRYLAPAFIGSDYYEIVGDRPNVVVLKDEDVFTENTEAIDRALEELEDRRVRLVDKKDYIRQCGGPK